MGPPDPVAASTPGNSSSDSVGATLSGTCAIPTSRVTIAANLDASAPLIDAPWSSFDPYDYTNFVASAQIVDARGEEHTLSIVFRKSAARAYDYHALVDSYVDVAQEQGGVEVSAGTLSFTTDGALETVTENESAPVKFPGIPVSQSIALDFGTSIEEGGDGFAGTISVAGAFAVAGQWHDGAACGRTPELSKACAWPHPQATTRVSVAANLDARMDVMPVLSRPWSVAQPIATSNFTITTTVYDSLGAAHSLGLHFRRTSLGSWDYHAVIEGDATPTEVGTGALSFDASGAIADVRTPMLDLSFPGAAPHQLVSLDFGGATAGSGGGGHMTELATQSVSLGTMQDGKGLPDNTLAGASICD